MSNIYKGEFQDHEGNVVYPHTTTDVVFTTEGGTVQQKLNEFDEVLDGVSGRTDSPEVSDSSILATSKAVNSVNQKLGGMMFRKDPSTGKNQISNDGGSNWENFNGGELVWDKVSSCSGTTVYNLPINSPNADNLTNNDFKIVPTGATCKGGWSPWGGGGSYTYNLTVSYDASTHILSCSRWGYQFPNAWATGVDGAVMNYDVYVRHFD